MYKMKSVSDLEKIPDFKRFSDSIRRFKDVIDTGKLAQFYCRELLGLVEVKLFNKRGPDLISSDGKTRYEVKYRKGGSGLFQG